MANTAAPQRFTARDIRALMIGMGHGSVTITRQAWRIHPDDTDEIVVARNGSEYWLARRLSDQITIWACHDEMLADDQFDELVDGTQGWVEASAAA